MAFDWKTDEEEVAGWREIVQPKRSRRRWLWFFGSLLLIAASLFFLWRAAARQVAENEAAMREEVRQSHALIRRAMAAEDVEVLRTVLSGRDQEWAAAQKALLEDGSSYVNAARVLGLERVGAPQEMSLELDAELRSAELVLQQAFRVAPAGEMIPLHFTFMYRRGTNRWLLAAPDDDFWGATRTTLRKSLVLSYPQRDEVLSLRLGRDLDEDVARVCSQLGSLCPANLIVSVTLTSDAQSLLELANGRDLLRAGRAITLPAPSLIGIPQEEAGYRQLHQVYARAVLGAVVADLAGWVCCDQAPFFQAVLQQLLHEADLQPPLLVPEELDAALELATDSVRLQDGLQQLWLRKQVAAPGERLPLLPRLFVAYLLDNAATEGQGAPELITALAATNSLPRWWTSFTGQRITSGEALTPPGMVSFLKEIYRAVPLPAGLSLPDQPLLLACASEDEAALWRYDVRAERWHEEMGFSNQQPMALVVMDDGSYFVTVLVDEAEEPMPFRLLYKAPGAAAVAAGDSSGGVWLPLTRRAQADTGAIAAIRWVPEVTEMPSIGIVTLTECVDNVCPWEEMPGLVTVAPDGRHEVANGVFDEPIISLRSAGGEWEAVGRGRLSFWLDEAIFATIGENGQRLIARHVDGRESLLLDVGEVDFIGDSQWLTLLGGTVYEAEQDTALLLATNTRSGRSWLLALKRPEGASWLEATGAEVRAELDGNFYESGPLPLEAMDDGRWLVAPYFEPNASPQIWLYDATGEVAPFSVPIQQQEFIMPAFDWSEDKQWLAVPQEGVMLLIAPGAGPHRRLLFPPVDTCQWAVWLSSES